MLNAILSAVIGCLLGVLTFKLIALVTSVASMGDWSTGILVAICIIWVEIIRSFPWWNKQVSQ